MSDTPDYVNGEPAPQHNFNPSVHDLLVNDAKHYVLGFGYTRINDYVINQMIDLFRTRKEYGFRKYGTILQAENGRDFLNDAVEETVDQLAYVRQGLCENPRSVPLGEAYRSAVQTLTKLIQFRDAREASSTLDA